MPWTYEDVQRIVAEAKAASDEYGLGLTIDRCKHPSVTNPVLWLFHDGQQVGTVNVARKGSDGEQVYTASKMQRGLPYTSKRPVSLKAAILHAGTDVHDRPHKAG